LADGVQFRHVEKIDEVETQATEQNESLDHSSVPPGSFALVQVVGVCKPCLTLELNTWGLNTDCSLLLAPITYYRLSDSPTRGPVPGQSTLAPMALWPNRSYVCSMTEAPTNGLVTAAPTLTPVSDVPSRSAVTDILAFAPALTNSPTRAPAVIIDGLAPVY
jgi:hypothetical protein